MSRTEVLAAAERARESARPLAAASSAVKDAALRAMADALERHCAGILDANEADVREQTAAGISEAMVDRLRLSSARVTAMADGLRSLATLPDPVGEVVRGATLANGLEMRQVRVPLGVIAMIYEGR